MGQMFEPLSQNLVDMFVSQRIQAILATFAHFHEFVLTKYSKLMGYSRLAHLQSIGQFIYGQFTVQQSKQNSNPGIIAENFIEIRQLQQNFIAWQTDMTWCRLWGLKYGHQIFLP